MPYRTIAAPTEAEIEIKKSRFIGFVAPVADEAEAREVIAERRNAHPKARHHCTAFVLDPDSRTQRFSDDGEPAGTAGAPILDVVTGHGLTFVVAVVTRYFGELCWVREDSSALTARPPRRRWTRLAS